MSSPLWYWHRLRAMRPTELACHARRKIHQFVDSRGSHPFRQVPELPTGKTFPVLPPQDQVPEAFKAVLVKDMAAILGGRWMAFGQIELQVDDPPRWHKDYLTGEDLATQQPAFKLNHRLQGNADIKLLWEPNRWFSLVRLAQAAYVLGDAQAAATCERWLQAWAEQNRPYLGWNWTSALETGVRLIQFVWMDALLDQAPAAAKRNWAALRAAILPGHVWYTWRDRSFGSSANNHLLGELSGLIVAMVRWPELGRWAVPVEKLQPFWEKEVLAQFHADGGNAEQALGYHWFSWEFCWQTRLALRAAGRTIAPEVEDRLRAGASFFRELHVDNPGWEYGDSDGAYVTPFFADWRKATREWRDWLQEPGKSPSIRYWLGEPPKPITPPAVVSGSRGWRIFQPSGMAVCHAGDWFLRWDLSPLGFLATAAHGHCDALHLSIWFKGEPIVIDPGTGAYYADKRVREYLASWEAHNGPRPAKPGLPVRMGMFLWSQHHSAPRWQKLSDTSLMGELRLPGGVMRRTITRLEAQNGWQIEDSFVAAADGQGEATHVFWQFPPGASLKSEDKQRFVIRTGAASVRLCLNTDWSDVEPWSPQPGQRAPGAGRMAGVCSPGFRLTEVGPFLQASGRASEPKPLVTVLLPGLEAAS